MNLTYVYKSVINSITGNEITLYYYTTENNGVGIDMYTETVNGVTKENKEFDSLFTTESEAEKFLKMLHKCCVTPTSLRDVVEDFIS